MSNPSSISSANTANLVELSFSGVSTEKESNHKVEKKRTRTLKSCLTCRQKKIKCDKLKPVCSTCIKKGTAHLCQYEDPQWSVKISKQDPAQYQAHQLVSPTQVSSELNTLSIGSSVDAAKDLELLRMNERIRQLENAIKQPNRFKDSPTSEAAKSSLTASGNSQASSENDIDGKYIDFYRDTFKTPMNSSQGPLSWISLMRKDVYLNSIALSAQLAKTIIDKKVNQNHSKLDEDFAKKWEREDHNTEGNFESSTKPANSAGLIAELRNYLNDSKLIWLLVDKFFESEFYLMLPIIDRDEFSVQLFDLIGSRGASEVNLNLRKRADLTTVGILLLVMRLTSLSSYNFGKQPFINSEKSQYIMEHPIERDAIELSNKIYSEVSAFKSPKLDTYQFMILRVYYETFGPEECDCINFANSPSIGQVLQYAVQCSLNRDPNVISNTMVQTKRKNMLRRLWYFVVFLDSYQLMVVGCPPIIDSKFYDTHFPHLDESENEFEYTVNEWFYERAKMYEICYPLLISILDVRTKITVGDMKEKLQPLLNYVDKLKSIEEIVQGPRDTVIQRSNKINDISRLIDCYSLIYMIYYHLFLFYNEKKQNELSLKYLLLIIKISAMLYELILFLNPDVAEYDLEKHFGIGAIIFPKIEMVLHRITQLLFTILSRIKGAKAFTSDLSPDIAKVLDEISDISTKTITYILIRFVQVSDKYYHPWVVSKVQAFILTNILSVPKGVHFSARSATDQQFIKALNRSRTIDDMFQCYSLQDFQQLKAEFLKFEKINNTNGANFVSNYPWSSDRVDKNDKRWLDQMINEYKFAEAGLYPDNIGQSGVAADFGNVDIDVDGEIIPSFYDTPGVNGEIPAVSEFDLDILDQAQSGETDSFPRSADGNISTGSGSRTTARSNHGFNVGSTFTNSPSGGYGFTNSIVRAGDQEGLHELINSNVDLFSMERFFSSGGNGNSDSFF